MKTLRFVPVILTLTAAPALATAAKPPAAGPAAAPTPADPTRARATSLVGDLSEEVVFRSQRARRLFERGEISPAKRDEIGRAMERGIEQVVAQSDRVKGALSTMATFGSAERNALRDELRAVETTASRASEDIANVRTHDDETEETLQEIASEIEEISDRAGSLAEEVEELASPGAGGDSGSPTLGDGGARRHGGVRIDSDDRVAFGGSVTVDPGTEVSDAVAFGGTVTVAGDVRGDAVAFGGDVRIADGGHVRGDAASFGGRVVVEDGGVIDGETIQLGTAGLAGSILGALNRPAATVFSWPTRMGFWFLGAGARFLCFFLLGLLVLGLAPSRVLAVASAVEREPAKAAGVGLLGALAFLPVTLLLVCTIVGIAVVPIFWLATVLAGFFGFVAVALVIARRLPTKRKLTQAGLLAVGSAVVVSVGLVPVIGKLLWLAGGLMAIGGVLMTRFGQDGSGGDVAVPASAEPA